MRFMIVFEGPWCWKPGWFRSDVVTRVWWGPVAIKSIKVSEFDYATNSWFWESEKGDVDVNPFPA